MRSDLNWKPERLDIEAFAKQGVRLEGQWSAAELERWQETNVGDASQLPIRWTLRGEVLKPVGAPPQLWLHLQADTEARLSCQRCLQPASFALRFERSFRFVRDEATALAEDPDSEEDLLVVSRAFDARELIEDELLLALPIVPMHERCDPPLPLAAADSLDTVEPQAERPNPFAVLASLRKDEKT
jgi:uncharacterized protein